MLIMANGAFKSGSTWLREIVVRMIEVDPIPLEYQHPMYAHWINPRRLPGFLADVDFFGRNFVSKSHLFGKRDVERLVACDGVQVLNIRRDLRDVIVSHYYHVRRQKKVLKRFEDYYWSIGRYKAYQMMLYHSAWPDADNVFMSSFERLKTDFHGEVGRVAGFLEIDVSRQRIAELEVETSLENLRRARGESDKEESERFFRKGQIGDWQQHFDEDMLRDLKAIQDGQMSLIDRSRYHFLFTARQAVKTRLGERSKTLFRLLKHV